MAHVWLLFFFSTFHAVTSRSQPLSVHDKVVDVLSVSDDHDAVLTTTEGDDNEAIDKEISGKSRFLLRSPEATDTDTEHNEKRFHAVDTTEMKGQKKVGFRAVDAARSPSHHGKKARKPKKEGQKKVGFRAVDNPSTSTEEPCGTGDCGEEKAASKEGRAVHKEKRIHAIDTTEMKGQKKVGFRAVNAARSPSPPEEIEEDEEDGNNDDDDEVQAIPEEGDEDEDDYDDDIHSRRRSRVQATTQPPSGDGEEKAAKSVK